MRLFKMTYDKWFRDRQQNWDFRDEEDFVFATSKDHAVSMIAGGHRVSHVVAREATVEELERYTKDNLD